MGKSVGKWQGGMEARGGLNSTHAKIGDEQEGRGEGESTGGPNVTITSSRRKRKRRGRFMKVMTINAQSLNNKLNEFKLLVNDKKPDIISITESWAKENTTDGIFALQGYTMYRDDKKTGTGGGGITVC